MFYLKYFIKNYGSLIFCTVVIFSFIGFLCYDECIMKYEITDRALCGDPVAIALCEKYQKPWTFQRKILEKALDRNKNALHMLKIEIPDNE